MSKQFGLGRGFDALLPTEVDKALLEDDSNRIQKLLITDVYANTEQPRKEFDQKALEELAESIRTHGVLQPIIVVQKNDKTYKRLGSKKGRARRA
jgi:ParB family chromosome partitioning protein